MISIALMLRHSFIVLLITVCIALIFFYYFVKLQLFKFAPLLAVKSSFIHYYPFIQAVGAIELSSTALFHVLFCMVLILIFKINLAIIFLNATLIDCLYGALIGIGCVGISVLLCSLIMKMIEITQKENAPKSLAEWSAISNAGWIRHHKHTIKVLRLPLALLIIILQIGSEETIFRGILIQVFSPYGLKTAFLTSVLLFICMQAFHMPTKMSAMFPVIGATVMGTIHGLLYLAHPSIMPLIISHLTFFIFTVI